MVLRILLVLFCLIFSTHAFSYPSEETRGTNTPPLSVGVSGTISGMILKDDTTLLLSYGQILNIIDMASFSKGLSQPATLSTSDKTDGVIGGITYNATTNDVIASQQDGDLLIFDLDSLSSKPTSMTVASNKNLGPVAVDPTTSRAYVANNSDRKLHLIDLSARRVAATIDLTVGSSTNFSMTDALYNPTTSDFYFTTDAGGMIVLKSGATSATLIDVNVANKNNLKALAATPDGKTIYAVDSTTPGLVKIDASNRSISKSASSISLAANASPTGIAIGTVTRPIDGESSAVYAFVAGSKGVSVINTANDQVFDLGSNSGIVSEPISMSITPSRVVMSSSSDGYVYLGNSTGSIGILSANPYITLSSLTFSGGKTKLGVEETATLVFQSDETGSYEARIGGGVTANGSFMMTTSGQASGSVPTANSNITIEFTYNANSSILSEGSNDLFVFVTDSDGNRGRLKTTLSVDTPPPNASLQTIGFGDEKLYLTFLRLTQSDIKHYNVYLSSSSSNDATTKTSADKTISQPGSGETVMGIVSGLNNGVAYFIAIEAEDTAGNKSPVRTTTLASGAEATGTPQLTVGPAGLSGEIGNCSLIKKRELRFDRVVFLMTIMLTPVLLILWRKSRYQKAMSKHRTMRVTSVLLPAGCVSAGGRGPMAGPASTVLRWLLIVVILTFSPNLQAEKVPMAVSIEPKTGFWIPMGENTKRIIEPCCNLITRVQGGALFWRRFGIEAGAGFLYKTGAALGASSGASSQDRFSLILVPMETNIVFRIEHDTWHRLAPYAKLGTDYIYFREAVNARTVHGFKYGAHVAGGVQIQLTRLGDAAEKMKGNYGIDDLFLTLEGQASWINSFGSQGFNLSGQLYSMGLMFLF